MADKVGFSCNMFVSRRFMLQVGGSSLGEKTSAVGKKKDVCYQSSKGKKTAQIANRAHLFGACTVAYCCPTPETLLLYGSFSSNAGNLPLAGGG